MSDRVNGGEGQSARLLDSVQNARLVCVCSF